MAAKKTATKKTVSAETRAPSSGAAAKRAGDPGPSPGSARAVLEIGQQAPDFTLPSDDGGEVSLSSLAGKKVVVYFYPRDNTPGCTREAHAFRDIKKQLAARNAVVLGISKDSIASHCKFRDDHGLNFPLLSDKDGAVLAAYGAYGPKTLYGKTSMGIIRSTVIIDERGKVKKVFPSVKVDGHAEQVLAALDA